MASPSTADAIDQLAHRIQSAQTSTPPSKRVLVSISGVPGAGKSTLARSLAERLNTLHASSSSQSFGATTTTKPTHASLTNPSPHAYAVDIPMDGFHYSRAHLRSMPDPEVAVHRRGAAFTYDAEGFVRLVQQLAEPVDPSSSGKTVYAPAFDHATKDPVADSISIGPATRVVILEGNYVNLDREPWRSVSGLFDVKLLAAVDRHVAKERLVKRHVSSGICEDEKAARYRVESTDDLNAEDILAHQVEGVVSVELPDLPGM